MFPYNPWRRWTPEKFVPTWRDLEFLFACWWLLWRITHAYSLVVFGLSCLYLLALATWAVTKDGIPGSDELLILTGAALFVTLYVWATWRFARKTWAAARASKAARPADPSP